ncbi:MAG: glycogen debranching enzyme N-terminal domain-containing protein [Verrucomicrobiales bacterium]|nr:glycogen debranching enzyme N-terminal domain-containing protein [Verrucomicrobiales bacterium]
MNSSISGSLEWLEADGLGGFASGTSTGIRTRRYHALLLTATTPPTGRMVLVNGLDAWAETVNGSFSLSSQYYAPDVLGGDGAQRIEAFGWEPWPHWIYKLEDGTRIELEIFAVKGQPVTCLSWKLLGPRRNVKLHVRPFLSGRDYHSLHKSNTVFRFDADVKPDRVSWRPYDGLPGVTVVTDANYRHEPQWYYNFLYEEERARGLDSTEDLAAPGVLSWNLAEGEAPLVLATTPHAAGSFPANVRPLEVLRRLRDAERKRRERFPSELHRAADAYIVERRVAQAFQPAGSGDFPGANPEAAGSNAELESSVNPQAGKPALQVPLKTIIAGYPWFTDWGRDTLISLRGLCLATGRLDVARDILLAWSATVSEGMLPNRFPDQGGQPEFNAADASLWFVIAVHEYLQLRGCRREEFRSSKSEIRNPKSEIEQRTLLCAVEAILEGYTQGTRFGIRADEDSLLACGVPGVQLTWMDAKVGDWVVTPRIGKPVEIQALWLNALWIASQHNDRWKDRLKLGLESFRGRFWNRDRGCLFDVVDVGHQPGSIDATLRPNQVLAVGGLPLALLDGEQARLVLEAIEGQLLTPLGLRSLGPLEPGYSRCYQGGPAQRDGCYHQGTVWPWLLGPFVEGWVRVRGGGPAAKQEARRRFLEPLLRHLEEAGLGHISEIADAESPHTPRGCPFQAWSVGEALRLDRLVLAESNRRTRPAKSSRKLATVSPLVMA